MRDSDAMAARFQTIATAGAALVALSLIVSGCTSTAQTTTTTMPLATLGTPPSGEPTTTLATAGAADTTSASTTSPAISDESSPPLIVVAEERERRLAIIVLTDECVAGGAGCQVGSPVTIALTERPHNLAAAGSVVYATHPAAGAVTRYDLATGELDTVPMGTEPHDVKFDPSGVLYVADERGQQLLTVDPDTLDIVDADALEGEPHDLAVGDGEVWVTIRNSSDLLRVRGDSVEPFPTDGSPHDLIVAPDGRIWFSNWNSDALNVFDPTTGATDLAPAGVVEPHHFALDPAGNVWVTDNGGDTLTGFVGDHTVTVTVGPTPHHVAFAGDIAAVAVSGSGEVVLVRDGEVIGRAALSEGLHGVAVVTTDIPVAER